MNQNVVKQIVVGIAALVLMIMFTACAGVGTPTPGGITSLSGSVVSVDLNNHTVTLNVNGQIKTINNVPNDVLAAAQNQVGKVYSIQVTQNSDGSFRGVTTLSGSVVSVDLNNHTVTLNVNGQIKTINNVPNDVLTTLQSQVGKAYSIQVTQNSDGSFSIESGTNVTLEANETSTSNETSTVNEPGSIDFIGKVQSVNSSSIVVSLPDGSTLPLNIMSGQTDLSKFNGAQPAVGQLIKVSATANNGSFTAKELKPTDVGDLKDQNSVTFQGVTTQAVGSDRVIHFTVGNKSFRFAIASTAELKDFGGNAQSIANGTSVKVKVLYSGTSGSALDVSNNNS